MYTWLVELGLVVAAFSAPWPCRWPYESTISA